MTSRKNSLFWLNMKTGTSNWQNFNVYQIASLLILKIASEASIKESTNLLESLKPSASKKSNLCWKASMNRILPLLEGTTCKMEDNRNIENYNHNLQYPNFKTLKLLLYLLNSKTSVFNGLKILRFNRLILLKALLKT